jgi:Mlc titration factor MtfA (ptsG expression regulator)
MLLLLTLAAFAGNLAGLLIASAIAWALFSFRRSKRTADHVYSLTEAQRAVLSKYAIHYQRLGQADKARFERIVAHFVHEKEWKGAGIPMEPEMKLMISACAAQLLLGYSDVVLKHFTRIVVYPRSYRSRPTGRMHQGEVRPQAGLILISWEDFLHGYAHTRDAHNVGLHEMAHALWFENSIANGEEDFLQPERLARWMDHAEGEMARIRKGQSRLFREYAATNQAEFFAVAVEYFFEQPTLFHKELPELYAILCGMLQQDPDKVLLS